MTLAACLRRRRPPRPRPPPLVLGDQLAGSRQPIRPAQELTSAAPSSPGPLRAANFVAGKTVAGQFGRPSAPRRAPRLPLGPGGRPVADLNIRLLFLGRVREGGPPRGPSSGVRPQGRLEPNHQGPAELEAAVPRGHVRSGRHFTVGPTPSRHLLLALSRRARARRPAKGSARRPRRSALWLEAIKLLNSFWKIQIPPFVLLACQLAGPQHNLSDLSQPRAARLGAEPVPSRRALAQASNFGAADESTRRQPARARQGLKFDC